MTILSTQLSAVLNQLTVDSTGDMPDRYGRTNSGGPKTYTLTARTESIDLQLKAWCAMLSTVSLRLAQRCSKESSNQP
jgi:hypothetical protein